MKLFFDLFPVAIFFGVYAFTDIYIATAAIIAACFVQSIGWRLVSGQFEKMHLLTLAIAIVFGGATLALHDPNFIMAKPTLIYGILALVFLWSQFIGEKSMVERMLGHALDLPSALWPRVNLCWVLFFAFLAYLNIFVVTHFSEQAWVNFKTFGDIALMSIFVVAQLVVLRRFLIVEPQVNSDGSESGDGGSSPSE